MLLENIKEYLCYQNKYYVLTKKEEIKVNKIQRLFSIRTRFYFSIVKYDLPLPHYSSKHDKNELRSFKKDTKGLVFSNVALRLEPEGYNTKYTLRIWCK